MKLLKKRIPPLIFIFATLMSCEEQPQPASVVGLEQLTKQSLASEDFQKLNVPLSDLNPEASAFVNANKNSIFIPFHGADDRHGIIALFSDAKKLRTVVEYEVITDVPADEVYARLKTDTFDGTFLFRTPDGQIELKTEKSKITSTTSRGLTSGRVSECDYITRSGGALGCAGSRIEGMNWFEKSLCYISFMACLAEESISCWIDGCEV